MSIADERPRGTGVKMGYFHDDSLDSQWRPMSTSELEVWRGKVASARLTTVEVAGDMGLTKPETKELLDILGLLPSEVNDVDP